MKKLLLMVSMLFMIVITACGNGNGTNSNQSSKPVEGSNPAQTGQEPVTISVVSKAWPDDDPYTHEMVKAIEEGMKAEGKNIKIKLIPIQSGSYPENLGLQLQTGNIPDLMYFQGGDYQFAITQQILEDLTPYVEGSTHLKASMSDFNMRKLENYPYLVWPFPSTTRVPVVRQDWFDKTSSGKALLENPTIDNYYHFFKEVKEVNGAKYAYTMALQDEIDMIFNQAFGLTSTWIKGDDGKYAYGLTTEFGKNKLEFYAKLYKDGLLDPEYLTKKSDTKEKAFYDGDAAVISGTQGAVIEIYNNKSVGQNGTSAIVMPLPPAKGVAQGYSAVDVSKENRGYAISSTSKNKEMAFALLEYMASPKGLMLDKLGIEGQHYEIVDNKIKLTDKFASIYARFVGNDINFKPVLEMDASTPIMSEPARKSMELVDSMSTEDNLFIIPNNLATHWDASTAVYTEFAADVITGKKTVADFDKFVKEWKSAGGQAVTDYANETLK